MQIFYIFIIINLTQAQKCLKIKVLTTFLFLLLSYYFLTKHKIKTTNLIETKFHNPSLSKII
jgi:hypothetical protein